ncbi:hypothetical protein FACS189431_3460 [Alphaproteobacteria bacterium]|nr:hypothetical protein FACS189431_3460 [Alphaproteobacteria bacterium]
MQDDTTKKPTVEDQELADMIASMNGAKPKTASPSPAATTLPVQNGTPTMPPPLPPQPAPAPAPLPNPPLPPAPSLPPLPKQPIEPIPAAQFTPPKAPVAPQPIQPATLSGNLDVIKKNALDELRPLVSHLDLPADEKFDTLLLLIRSTDDKSLVKPAYDAAAQIKDDARRASALLDIVKEIDFFDNPQN